MAPSETDVRLSVLDTSPIVQGSTARQALHNTLDLARFADELGYYRYWVSEHHSMRGVASSAPAVLVGRIAAATDRMRVGSGGVLLPNHAPLVVAEQFGTLEALHPGRIDLGLGRAPGGPPDAVAAIRSAHARTEMPFAERLHELLGYFDPPEDQTPTAVPAVGNQPHVWILGSSTASAELAGSVGLPYAFAHHLNPEGLEAVQVYKDAFRPSPMSPAPQIIISVSVIAADTDERAEWLAGSTRLKVLSRMRGKRILLPSPEDAAAYPYTAADREEIAARSQSVLVGAPTTVRSKLNSVLNATGADELMVTTPVYNHADRRRSYDLLSSLAFSCQHPARGTSTGRVTVSDGVSPT
ncbi:LLM class flavin-dependent oxidoreductase [Saccharopolyspora phatthalungensis]|uniref:Luciferase family oxidoreductase group 1 n=1 Tax=Saccharopolyspora phatthalungensis TaxID=664693 RepID=A0A840Q9E1_9PSEU|nr:LLM class flavin-dependent oxidoreductase [Saccharopolyspora phatthalungensis]MBB5159162.1 luciferase family oxidoreductase group 1 [Saccharopolyspora phatthalungensis]